KGEKVMSLNVNAIGAALCSTNKKANPNRVACQPLGDSLNQQPLLNKNKAKNHSCKLNHVV
ncbi:MAG: hypothetical protein V2B14_05690, partial [bacterium]